MRRFNAPLNVVLILLSAGITIRVEAFVFHHNSILTWKKNPIPRVCAFAGAGNIHNDGEAPKKNRKSPRQQQRFLQDAHIGDNRINRTERQRRTAGSNSNNNHNIINNNDSITATNFDKQPQAIASSSSSTTRSNRKQDSVSVDSELMWRTSKSIDEIEANMVKRWGTELSKWAADPNEYEFDYTSDQTADSGQNYLSTDTKEKNERPDFRAKPVLDPWQKEDLLVRKRKQASISANEPAGIFSVASDEDLLLKRAHRNQQNHRLVESRSRKPSWGSLIDEEEQVTDFYDEDDEGYELAGTSISARDKDNIGKLISPRPVGGQGTKSAMPPSNPGYFFNANAAMTNVPIHDPTEKLEEFSSRKQQQQSTTSRNPSPLLDQNGKPMWLTLSQAERNFKAILAAETSHSDTSAFEKSISWKHLGITSQQLILNLQAMGCETPLSVQTKSCPSILTSRDVLIGTYTGSGKTLAFLVPLVQRLLFEELSPRDGVQILIIAPGRELASQIATVARNLLVKTNLSVLLAIGGTTFSRNLEQLRQKKPAIVVGTPGRIAELVVGQSGEKIGRMKISSLQTVVFDEFDALLEYKPHRDPTAALMAAVKRRHRDSLQSILCSATATDMIGSAKLSTYLRPGFVTAMADKDDQLITGGDDNNVVTRVSRTVIHGVVHAPRRQLALSTIRKILHTEPMPQQVLIFADNARRVDLVVEKLAQQGIVAAPLHGATNSEKMDRAEVSKALREGYVGIVVATELAARGIDAPLLTHVINLDLPTDASHYAHRAGRCGRGGRPGVVINITTGPKERNVPKKLSDQLGVEMFTVEPRGGRLTIVDPTTVILDEMGIR